MAKIWENMNNSTASNWTAVVDCHRTTLYGILIPKIDSIQHTRIVYADHIYDQEEICS